MDIRLHHINKQFDEKQVLKDVNMTIVEGDIYCIMGASGAGKTTLVNILMGIIKQDAGEITGMNKRKIAAVFQEDRLIEHWDAVKNILLVCNKSMDESKVKDALEEVGLKDHLKKPVMDLSGGMRRRVAVVRALMADSELIIMDEPFKGLDEALKQQMIQYVKKRTKGKTVILITHDKEEALGLNAKIISILS
ncbi:ABC transporter ATP-binding protein [Mobilitalea sibirica]|uniref:ABC transporter ATP-binding protein n=1 Tax=Mobilitalea sibirica TaxID=1462919 RepID=A0A8J7H0G5_9FIRM|nr:ATP-binding cassette domain-containing protein [Mobilitalea sibirica]MBH1941889.1 ABC transporter ATP-binding protein [Mobilitalea sibirica]